MFGLGSAKRARDEVASGAAACGGIDTEPLLADLLEARKARRGLPPYAPKLEGDVAALLESYLQQLAPGSKVSGVSRAGGGASKEQFFFTLNAPDGGAQRYILRMDPLEAITETSRAREYEALRAFCGVVPAPKPVWLDADGAHFGRPAVIMECVDGVTKPSADGAVKVSGLGTQLGDRLRALLKPQFLDCLVRIHGLDWRAADLPSFTAPTFDPKQSARWQLEYWAEMWRQDADHASPIVTLAENWLRGHVPDCEEPVFVHGDYRTGNYLFDEASGRITAILDWELAYVGDFHDDLAWVVQRVFGTVTNGVFRVSDLFEREEFLSAYEIAAGRKINPRTLHFYEVLSAYKTYVIVAANGMAAARYAHNHQDVLLTFLAAAGPLFRAELCRLLSEGPPT